MMPISDVSTSAVRPLATAEKIPGAPRVQKSEEESQGRQMKPVMDEYVRSEPQEPSGRYWMGRDEDGQPRICFDDRSRAADVPKQPEGAPEKPEADAPEEPDPADQGAKGPEGTKDKGETWECNTDKADREIEKLKKKKEELEQRLNTETDEARIKALEQQLAQVESELRQKDNDTYRRQHTTVRQLS